MPGVVRQPQAGEEEEERSNERGNVELVMGAEEREPKPGEGEQELAGDVPRA